MTIDELTNSLKPAIADSDNDKPDDVVEGEFVETDEDDDECQADLTTALSLLDDCYNFIESILDPRWARTIPIKQLNRVQKLGEEVYAFLDQYEDIKIDKPISRNVLYRGNDVIEDFRGLDHIKEDK